MRLSSLFTFGLRFILIMSTCLNVSLFAKAQSSAAVADEISRGISLYKSGDDKGAVKVLSAAVKMQKENADAWRYLALAQMRSGDTNYNLFNN